MARLALVFVLAVTLTACGSSRGTSAPAAPDASNAVAEAERAIERAEAEADPMPDLEGARRSLREAEALLEQGEMTEAAHRAYLARQGARLAVLQAEIDQAERGVMDADAQGGRRILVTDAFETARITLKPESRAAVDRVTAYLSEHPDRVVLIESFTDATGSAERNLDLSVRRAEAVRTMLIEAGVAPERVVAAGYGQEYPVASNDTAEDRRFNRRIEFTVSDRVDTLPTREPAE